MSFPLGPAGGGWFSHWPSACRGCLSKDSEGQATWPAQAGDPQPSSCDRNEATDQHGRRSLPPALGQEYRGHRRGGQGPHTLGGHIFHRMALLMRPEGHTDCRDEPRTPPLCPHSHSALERAPAPLPPIEIGPMMLRPMGVPAGWASWGPVAPTCTPGARPQALWPLRPSGPEHSWPWGT